jgi:CRP/FNR family transcriptional regulator
LASLTIRSAASKRHEPRETIATVNMTIEPSSLTNLRPARPMPPVATRTQNQNLEVRRVDAYSCSACLRYEFNLCSVLNKKIALVTNSEADAPELWSSVHSIPSRRPICHAKEWSEYVTIICEGWAVSSTALPDGRRQIHSILLPGDVALSTGPFNPVFGHTVEAITNVVYRRYKRTELESLVFENPDLFRRLTGMWNEARVQANQLALSLGRRTAHERIACFILVLADSLARRDMMFGDTMEFPLRLKHIADATGLTPVHVSKVQTEFQRAGLIEIKDRSITILDRVELRHIAGPQ